ncbi:glycosyltransferase [Vibrio breoganii]
MKKVMLIHDHKFKYYRGEYYTSASLDYKLLDYYKNFGDELHVISRCEFIEELPVNYAKSSGDNIYFHPQPNVRSFGGLIKIFGIYRLIRSLVKNNDLVFIKIPSTLGVVCFFSLFKTRNNIVIEVIGNVLEANRLHGSVIGKYLGFIEHYITKYLVLKSKNTVYITKEYLQKFYPTSAKNIAICPNAYITPVPFDDNTSVNLNKRIGLIGSLDVDYKGHDIALRVLKELVRKDDSWRLYFVGGGNSERWKQKAEKLGVIDNVNFVGSLKTGNDVYTFIDSMSLMLQPSLVEAQGRCIIEAMSRAKPVVATEVGGIPEILPARHVFPVDSIVPIADTITLLLSDIFYYRKTITEQMLFLQDFNEEKIKKDRLDFIIRIDNEKDN